MIVYRGLVSFRYVCVCVYRSRSWRLYLVNWLALTWFKYQADRIVYVVSGTRCSLSLRCDCTKIMPAVSVHTRDRTLVFQSSSVKIKVKAEPLKCQMIKSHISFCRMKFYTQNYLRYIGFVFL